jgi:hypothetical protein
MPASWNSSRAPLGPSGEVVQGRGSAPALIWPDVTAHDGSCVKAAAPQRATAIAVVTKTFKCTRLPIPKLR